MNEDTSMLQGQIDELTQRFKLHKHLGTDLTQKLATTSTSTSSYGGVVNADGSAGHLPTGWSSALSVSTYTVTHSLGISSYSVVAMINNDTALCGITLTQNTNNFTVQFPKNAGGSETSKVWNFHLNVIT